MRPYLIIIFCLFVSVSNGIAQNNTTYSIVFYKGDVSYSKSKQSNDWKIITTTSTKLLSGYKIRLGANSQIALQSNKNSILYTNAAVFTIPNSLKTKKSCLSKFVDYVMDNIAHHETDLEKDKNRHLEILGAVSRGNTCSDLRPAVGLVFGDSIRFSWEQDKSDSYLSVYSDNKGINAVYTQKFPSAQSSINISVVDLHLKEDSIYSWNISSSSNHKECALQSFQWESLSTFNKKNLTIVQSLYETKCDAATRYILLATYYYLSGYKEQAFVEYQRASATDTTHQNKLIQEFENKYLFKRRNIEE